MDEQRIISVIDVTGIQEYMFGSNEVEENVGASHLVHLATTAWLEACLPCPHNRQAGYENHVLEQHQDLHAEIISTGGGNALVLFRTMEDAHATVACLSRKVLLEAPGLELAAAHHAFTWSDAADTFGGVNGAHAAVYRALNLAKQRRRRSMPLSGLGVTAECRATGLPANAGGRERPVTHAVQRKRAASQLAFVRQKAFFERGWEGADAAVQTLIADITGQRYAFTRAFDDLGGTRDDMDYLAVVHADGNGIGKLFEDCVNGGGGRVRTCRARVNALRGLSQAVDEAGRRALIGTVARLTDALGRQPTPALKRLLESLERTKRGVALPIRLLVYGGDDVTFVCDGRLGVALAAAFLEQWHQSTSTLPGGPLHACAGVAIIKTGYPFARGYQLADQLCSAAKQAVRDSGAAGSAIDWQLAIGGITGHIAQIRAREYTYPGNPGHRLCARPLRVRGNAPLDQGSPWRDWQTFQHVSTALVDGFADKRNKLKELREVFHQGSAAVETFIQTFALTLPQIGNPVAEARGFDAQGISPYFDAIELHDVHVSL